MYSSLWCVFKLLNIYALFDRFALQTVSFTGLNFTDNYAKRKYPQELKSLALAPVS